MNQTEIKSQIAKTRRLLNELSSLQPIDPYLLGMKQAYTEIGNDIILPVLELIEIPLLNGEPEPDELTDWTKPLCGKINCPDELDNLVNSIRTQIGFHAISGKGEVETACSIAFIAHKFFKNHYGY